MEESKPDQEFFQKEKYNLSCRKLKKSGVRRMNEYQKKLIDFMLYEQGLNKRQKDNIFCEIRRVEIFLKREFFHSSFL